MKKEDGSTGHPLTHALIQVHVHVCVYVYEYDINVGNG